MQSPVLALFAAHLEFELQLAPRSVERYVAEARGFLRFLAGTSIPEEAPPPVDVSRRLVLEYLAELRARGLSRTTVARYAMGLRRFLRFAHARGLIAAVPSVRVPENPRARPLPRPAGETLLLQLFAELPESGMAARDRALLEVLYGSGLTAGELEELRLEDLRDDGTVLVRGAGGRGRYVPLTSPARAALEESFAERGVRPGPGADGRLPVFVNARGERLSRGTVGEVVRRFLPAASRAGGVGAARALRDSFAVHLLDRGASLVAVQELLGHVSLRAAERYARGARQDVLEAYQGAHPRA